MPKVKNETKLKKLAAWLGENGIEYRTYEWRKGYARKGHCDLFIPQYMVSVKIEDKFAGYFFRRHKFNRHPVFIRDKDTPKFVIEKVQNTIIKVMCDQQKYCMKQQKKQQRNEDKPKD